MAVAAICSATFGNLGSACLSGNTLAPATGIVLTTDSFEFASGADFSDLTKWEDAIKAKQIFPLMDLIETIDESDETTYFDSTLGKRVKLREGFYKFKYQFHLPLEVTKELRKFAGAKLRYIVIDEKNQARGYSPDGVVHKGYSISNFDVEKLTTPTAEGLALTTVSIVEQNPSQLNDFGSIISPTWELEDLRGLINVDILEIGTSTSGNIDVSVNYDTGLLNSDGSKTLIPIIGLADVDDFVCLTEVGAAQQITAVTDNGDGTYKLSGTGLVTGSVNLANPSDMVTDGLLIESTGATPVTIA